MSKYVNLTTYLARLDQGVWNTTFDEVEHILGFSLPTSARQYQAWWANQMRSQSMAWQSAGWKTASVDLHNEKISFVYVNENPENEVDGPDLHLTISEAKLGLANALGLKPEQVEIVIRA
ncbi:hypothetical protein M2337_001368 [Sphingobium sp. B2D3A]|uniref:DUF7662 domain-containing protein n=1 Tax=unclassified Sphingobium TaxID=2611147 RepID=UPI0022244AE8|nr:MULTISPECIES: hypothetical protein [unclassified Sphingobium]MCW2337135.1 hypothetical protein [Sphingobium sp. B2D3A]MCW2383593.1 hypothetical protein [Sphingobium sp. B2D3D]